MTVARRETHVTIKVDTTKLDEALARLREAEARYRALVAGELDCPSWWPEDPPGPDYTGTRCQLLQGHDQGQAPTQHRHRMAGSQVVVTWP